MKLKKLKIKKFQGKSTNLHRSPGTHISDKCLSDFICPNLMEAFEIHPNIKVLSHNLSNVNADDDPPMTRRCFEALGCPAKSGGAHVGVKMSHRPGQRNGRNVTARRSLEESQSESRIVRLPSQMLFSRYETLKRGN